MSDGQKYRQRGYKDSEREEKPRPGLQGPREKKDGPRGRGLGAPSEAVFRCAACGDNSPRVVIPNYVVSVRSMAYRIGYHPAKANGALI